MRTLVGTVGQSVLATDDPALFETDIGEAYRRVCLGTRLGVAEVRAITLNAVQAAWLDEPSPRSLGDQWTAAVALAGVASARELPGTHHGTSRVRSVPAP